MGCYFIGAGGNLFRICTEMTLLGQQWMLGPGPHHSMGKPPAAAASPHTREALTIITSPCHGLGAFSSRNVKAFSETTVAELNYVRCFSSNCKVI